MAQDVGTYGDQQPAEKSPIGRLSLQMSPTSQLLLRRFALVAIAVIVAIAAALTVAILFLGLESRRVPTMIELLLASSIISLGLGALFIWISSGRQWNTLFTRLIAAHAVAMLVVAFNVIIAAYAMFQSNHDLSLLGLLLAFSVVIAIIYSILASTAIGDSLRTVSAAAHRMSAGDLTARVPKVPVRELAELGTTLNTMAAQLDTTFKRQRQVEEARQAFIAAVSQDLRTPVASLRVMVEAINDGVVNDPETVGRYIQAMERETVNLGRLINDLFEVARLDAGEVQLRARPNPIVTIVDEAVEGLRAQAARQRVALRTHVDRSLPAVMVDTDRIHRVFYNLIENAIKQSPESGSVIVEVFDRGPDVQVNVRDTGDGIPVEDLPHVFDRFYRGNKAGSGNNSAGAGLGLSIARRLVELHGGRIWVSQPPGGGSIFSFTLPKTVAPRQHAD